uniref:CiaD-like domain-containing protein n=1 Tax=uncultured Campylobacter sp. TaxID=218934 RepID=UPI002621335C
IIEAVNEMKAQKRAQDLTAQQEGAVNANGAEAEAQASQDALSPASFAPDTIAPDALNSTSAPDIASSNAQNFTSLDTKNSTSRFVPSDDLNSALDRSNALARKNSAPSGTEFTADATLKKSAAKDENFTFSGEENFKNSDLAGGQNSVASVSLNGENFKNSASASGKDSANSTFANDGILKSSAAKFDESFRDLSGIAGEIYDSLGSDMNGFVSPQSRDASMAQSSAKSKDFELALNSTDDNSQSKQDLTPRILGAHFKELSNDDFGPGSDFKESEANDYFGTVHSKKQDFSSLQAQNSVALNIRNAATQQQNFVSQPQNFTMPEARDDELATPQLCNSAAQDMQAGSLASSGAKNSAVRQLEEARHFGAARQAGDKSKYLANADFKISSEAEFLSAIKERILVLFEGLNAFEKGDLNARVELNLKFMEFLLASIENRLENLPK